MEVNSERNGNFFLKLSSFNFFTVTVLFSGSNLSLPFIFSGNRLSASLDNLDPMRKASKNLVLFCKVVGYNFVFPKYELRRRVSLYELTIMMAVATTDRILTVICIEYGVTTDLSSKKWEL